MTIPEAGSIDELIEDCADIPTTLRVGRTVPTPRVAPNWLVTDACLAQVHDLDEYL